MNIGILITGDIPKSCLYLCQNYGIMLENQFKKFSNKFSFSHINLLKNENIPKMDAYIISGSPFAAYEKQIFQNKIEQFIQDAYQANTPLIGICYGHQIIAWSLGGIVENSKKGWGIGIHSYHKNEFDFIHDKYPLGKEISCLVSHQDQVTKLAPSSVTLYGSEFCPNAMVYYQNSNIISCQMHPEFNKEFALELYKIRKDIFPFEIYEKALKSLDKKNDNDQISEYILHMANFL